MSFDYYASLAEMKTCLKQVKETGLASGLGDGCLVWSYRDGEKNNARQCYMKRAAELDLNLPQDLHFEPDHASLPASTWFGIEVSFTLASPWYSRDDRPFHVLDNPVRKDRVFGVPFMSAASWKGLLRWACRMQAGLSDHLEKHNMKMDGWEDPTWIVHLFGNEKGEDECFQAGALVCYPTWFNKIGFEVINPHSRTRRAGTQPIYYEVVPAGTKGRLRLLYSPLPGEIERDKVTPADFIASFINSIKELLETYGISAKRTAGLGTARIDYEKSKFFFVEGGWMNKFLVESEGARHEEPPREEFKKLLDKSGNPISSLLDENGELKSKTQFKKLQGSKPCTNREFEEFKEWWEKHGKEYRRLLSAKAKNTPSPHTRAMSFQEVMDAVMRRPNTRKGGDQ